jgi:hypothetical protein
VIAPVISILDGTWASGAAPGEWEDYCLMKGMGWSWSDLQEVSPYVRRFCIDFLGMEARNR